MSNPSNPEVTTSGDIHPGVHAAHCTSSSCKYGSPDCPVTNGHTPGVYDTDGFGTLDEAIESVKALQRDLHAAESAMLVLANRELDALIAAGVSFQDLLVSFPDRLPGGRAKRRIIERILGLRYAGRSH